jgi:hypothetical protein
VLAIATVRNPRRAPGLQVVSPLANELFCGMDAPPLRGGEHLVTPA